MHRLLIYLSFSSLVLSCQETTHPVENQPESREFQLTLEQAEKLADLPLDCISKPLPYKSGLTIARESDLKMPVEHHPAFYGCFDWHSSMHGHWSLVYLLKHFPGMSRAQEARSRIDSNLTADHIPVLYYSGLPTDATAGSAIFLTLKAIPPRRARTGASYYPQTSDRIGKLAGKICGKAEIAEPGLTPNELRSTCTSPYITVILNNLSTNRLWFFQISGPRL